MTDDVRASVPDNPGPAPDPRDFVLTPAQYYTRLTGAFIVGAAAGAAIAWALIGARADEPPIKVRGGGVAIELMSSSPDGWDSGGNKWTLRSGGSNSSGEYKFTIVANTSCTMPPAFIRQLNIKIGTVDAEIKVNSNKTTISPESAVTIDPNNALILNHTGTGTTMTITAKPRGGGGDWVCTLEVEQFQEMCLGSGCC